MELAPVVNNSVGSQKVNSFQASEIDSKISKSAMTALGKVGIFFSLLIGGGLAVAAHFFSLGLSTIVIVGLTSFAFGTAGVFALRQAKKMKDPIDNSAQAVKEVKLTKAESETKPITTKNNETIPNQDTANFKRISIEKPSISESENPSMSNPTEDGSWNFEQNIENLQNEFGIKVDQQSILDFFDNNLEKTQGQPFRLVYDRTLSISLKNRLKNEISSIEQKINKIESLLIEFEIILSKAKVHSESAKNRLESIQSELLKLNQQFAEDSLAKTENASNPEKLEKEFIEQRDKLCLKRDKLLSSKNGLDSSIANLEITRSKSINDLLQSRRDKSVKLNELGKLEAAIAQNPLSKVYAARFLKWIASSLTKVKTELQKATSKAQNENFTQAFSEKYYPTNKEDCFQNYSTLKLLPSGKLCIETAVKLNAASLGDNPGYKVFEKRIVSLSETVSGKELAADFLVG
jgi:hypothetical protein